jgi:hypothetical protein
MTVLEDSSRTIYRKVLFLPHFYYIVCQKLKEVKNTMNFKIVKLLVFSALFFSILFATFMLMTNTDASMKEDYLVSKSVTEGHPSAILTGDPVGGGFPQIIIPTGDPVGGGFPQAHTIVD